MPDPNQTRPPPRTALAPTSGAIITRYPARITTYEIAEQDLDFFASGARSLYTGIAGTCIGSFVSVSLLLALNWSADPTLKMIMVALATGAGIAGLIFAGLAYRDYRAHQTRLTRFKQSMAGQERERQPVHRRSRIQPYRFRSRR